ncbi:hypothetical protein C8Q75DRAFT_166674 [Abortiporus biennis]|nr:hypothetical protein C8Q75DRAFT_166674 [Abortiporus biennis]
MRHSFQWRNLRYVISATFDSIKSKENPRLNEEPTFRQEAQQLPPELIIHIVSLFNDDRQTLKKCCLVSSAWLDLCRSQLYNDFTITITRVKDFLATVDDLERFEGVAKHIKNLIVYCDYHWGKPHQKPMICSHLFRGLLEKLPNLRSLTIRNARFSHSASHQTWKNFSSLCSARVRSLLRMFKLQVTFVHSSILGESCLIHLNNRSLYS